MDNSETLNNTARLILAKALKELFPKVVIIGGESTSKGFILDIVAGQSAPSEKEIDIIEERVEEIIRRAIPIQQMNMTSSAASPLFLSCKNYAAIEKLDHYRHQGRMEFKVAEIDQFADFCASSLKNTNELRFFKLFRCEKVELGVRGQAFHRFVGFTGGSKQQLKEDVKLEKKKQHPSHLDFLNQHPIASRSAVFEEGIEMGERLLEKWSQLFSDFKRITFFQEERIRPQMAQMCPQRKGNYLFYGPAQTAPEERFEEGIYNPEKGQIPLLMVRCAESELPEKLDCHLQTTLKFLKVLGLKVCASVIAPAQPLPYHRKKVEKYKKLLRNAAEKAMIVASESEKEKGLGKAIGEIEGEQGVVSLSFRAEDRYGREWNVADVTFDLSYTKPGEMGTVKEGETIPFFVRPFTSLQTVIATLYEGKGSIPSWIFPGN